MTGPTPTRDLEDAARASGHRVIAFVDEVGRGSAAGPLYLCALVPGHGPAPAGVADSKLLTAKARQRLVPAVQQWAHAWSIGQASAEEIDQHGMSSALRMAAHRALAGLADVPDLVILDGPHDYIGAPYTVQAHIKADQREVAAAAASVVAKVARDAVMVDLDATYPGYGLARNAGYLSPAHRAALVELGPTPEHRTTWAFMDGLEQWAHLRRTCLPPADAALKASSTAGGHAGHPDTGPTLTL